MININFIIIGQGIAGTLLSFELHRSGKEFLVVDQARPFSASKVSGAVINPWGGIIKRNNPKREAYFTQARNTYQQMEGILNKRLLTDCAIAVFHADQESAATFAQTAAPSIDLSAHFKQMYGCGLIQPAAYLHNGEIMNAWREFLQEKHLLIEAEFDMSKLRIEKEFVQYNDVKAEKIIFCGGPQDHALPYFSKLPFTRNRGDMLLLRIPELPEGYVFHGPLRLIPRGKQQFWCGSNYNWHFEDLRPDELWRSQTEAKLSQWLKPPFEVVDHQCALRPTTAGQIPLIGWHPHFEHIGIVNGLGTKGFSAGPSWIRDFVKSIVQKDTVNPHQATLNRWLS